MGAPPSLPLLTRASRPLTFEITAVNEKGEVLPISIAGENPLTLYVDKREIVTLMTLGVWPEALAIGYLRNQRLVESLQDIVSVQVDWDVNAVAVTTRHGLGDVTQRMQKRTVTTGCGQGTMFGDLMQDIENIRLPADAWLNHERLLELTQEVRQLQTIHKQAGAVHGCALAGNRPDGVKVLMFIEDVGRHNAVDAIAGRMWLEGLEGGDKIFFTTGRLTSEMVIKTAQMGIPFLISRNGVTQMGWEIARQTGITLIGRAQGRHYLVYTGAERFSR
ncbi:MAG TPA: formate dehydrogenase accessory sulfurtransferase FdhD [Burkholderiaceae bacterium]|nr:formate dehydrogenase accessory sulfurtransferase FdhD [Burkholderiaceae bacterium]